MSKRARYLLSCATAGIAITLAGRISLAAPAFSGGNITYTLDADTASANGGSNSMVGFTAIPSSGSLPGAPTYQYKKTLPFGGSSGTGSASLGHITSSTTAGAVLSAGTGIVQVDPKPTPNGFASASSLRIDINNLTWSTPGGLPAGFTGYFSVALGVAVPPGGAVSFNANLNFDKGPATPQWCSSYVINPSVAYTGSGNGGLFTSTPGSAPTFTFSKVFNGGVAFATNQTIRLNGFLEFKCANDDFFAGGGGLDFEFSTAPPTWDFASGTLWNEPATWRSPTDGMPPDPGFPPLPPLGVIPDAVDARARLVQLDTPGVPPNAELNITAPVTIGTLVVDRPRNGALGIAGANLNFDVSQENAVLHLRNLQGNGILNLSQSTILHDTLEAIVDSTGGVNFGGPVNANPGAGIIKRGRGPLTFASTATIDALTIEEGPVVVNGNLTALNGVNITGGLLSGNGTTNGPVHVQAGGAIAPAGIGGVGTQSFTGSLQVSGGTMHYDLADTTVVGSGVNDLVQVSGNVDLSTGGKVAIRRRDGALTAGSYRLVDYTGTLLGGGANLTVPLTRHNLTVDTSIPGQINLLVGPGQPANLNWSGAAGNTWQVGGGTGSWNNGPLVDAFFQWDNVTFDDTGSTGSVVLQGELNPDTILVNNQLFAYNFGGSGALRQVLSLTKAGSGVLNIANTGPNQIGTVVVNGGVVNVDTPSVVNLLTINAGKFQANENLTIGSTQILPGGILQIGGGGSIGFGSIGSGVIVNNGGLIFNRPDDITVANPITGNGNLQKLGAGVLSIGAIHANNLNVAAGSVRINPAGTSTSVVQNLVISAGAQLDLTDNALVIDYTGPIGNLLDTVRQQLQSARLTSTFTYDLKRLGVVDNGTQNRLTFAGVAVDPSSVLIALTLPGDTNLDRFVDITDLGALATNWQSAGGWDQGDFDYNGFIDITDLGMLATSWQLSGGPPLGPALDQALSRFGLPSVVVPEPTALAILAALPMALVSRRRSDPSLSR